ncbi:DUF4491 family protein [Anaerotruncus massiliensis (ex Togo et al. 2019)]|uniref:DUF4491 family protein n=1 Tax=Anaerotruncus massiliensis (ex Togo et al. 2019) TaxID=1673720 RepID=UPI0027B9B2BE|nr:DUF4491 family protein [Anaerotruncus massiliensis (ex Togo et al. 2019)]
MNRAYRLSPEHFTGLAPCAASVFVAQPVLSVALAVADFFALWSIGKLKEQEERVRKG